MGGYLLNAGGVFFVCLFNKHPTFTLGQAVFEVFANFTSFDFQVSCFTFMMGTETAELLRNLLTVTVNNSPQDPVRKGRGSYDK